MSETYEYLPAIYSPTKDSWLYLPPFGLVIDARAIVDHRTSQIPLADPDTTNPIVVNANRIVGFTVSLSGFYYPSLADDTVTDKDGILWQDILRDYCFDLLGTGQGRKIAVCEFTESEEPSTSVVCRVYRDCYAIGDVTIADRPTRMYPSSTAVRSWAPSGMWCYSWSLDLQTGNPRPWTSALNSDGETEERPTADGSPYVGLLPGTGEDGNVVVLDNTSIANYTFDGLIDTTAASGDASHRQQKAILHPTKGATVYGLELSAEDAALADGNTVVRVSDTDCDSAGNYIENTLESDEEHSDPAEATGSLTISSGSSVYVYVETAGNHKGLRAKLRLKIG